MKLNPEQRVSYPEAKKRALKILLPNRPLPASYIAEAIWPGHSMKAQGAGAAASRILKRMQKEGLAEWRHIERHWGWIRLVKP